MFRKIDFDTYINTDVIRRIYVKPTDDGITYKMNVEYLNDRTETLFKGTYEYCHKKLIEWVGLQSTLNL